jgi:hypothetical protein
MASYGSFNNGVINESKFHDDGNGLKFKQTEISNLVQFNGQYNSIQR